jgi:hypothetical protein
MLINFNITKFLFKKKYVKFLKLNIIKIFYYL